MDRDLIDKVTRDEELSGMLNVVLIAARRRRYVKSPSVQEIKRRYQALVDPVKAWVDERCVVGPEYISEKNLLHSDFINYCWKKKLKMLELNALGRELAKYGIRDRQIGTDKQHVWSGIKAKRRREE